MHEQERVREHKQSASPPVKDFPAFVDTRRASHAKGNDEVAIPRFAHRLDSQEWDAGFAAGKASVYAEINAKGKSKWKGTSNGMGRGHGKGPHKRSKKPRSIPTAEELAETEKWANADWYRKLTFV